MGSRRMCSLVILAAALASTRASRADDDAAAKARALYQEGARLYNLGQYEGAVRAFEGSYAISGAKPLLFNIAQAYRLSGPAACASALQAYESYLREDAAASNRREVEERIVEMRECKERERAREEAEEAARAARAAASPPSPSPSPPAPAAERAPGPSSPSVAPKVVTVAGAGLVVVGGGMLLASRLKYDHVKSTCPCPEGTFSTWEAVTTTSYVVLATGGAAFAGGLSWWIASARRSSAPSYAVTLGPRGVELSGTF
jgi:tetratricopeptide (TPR) repeat protein